MKVLLISLTMRLSHTTVLIGTLILTSLSIGQTAQAADYSAVSTETAERIFTDTIDTKKFFSKANVQVSNGDVILAQDDADTYLNQGSIARLGHSSILKHHYRYFTSAAITMDADLPEGTSIDLYLRTVDPEGSYGVHVRSKKWTKVEEGEKINLRSFYENYQTGLASENKLRWKAVLRTDDASVTPTLHSVMLTYYKANQKPQQLKLLQNTFGVNRTAGANVAVTLYGSGFQEGQEEVYLKDLFAASSVEYVNSKTLVATFPIESLSAGSYTVVVRNSATDRIAVTDGTPLYYYNSEADPEHERLVLKWFAPEIDSFSPATVTYQDGGKITLRGKYFSYGSTITIDNDSNLTDDDPTLPSDSVTIIDSNTITIDLTSGIITQLGLDRDTDLTIVLTTPDFQSATIGKLRID